MCNELLVLVCAWVRNELLAHSVNLYLHITLTITTCQPLRAIIICMKILIIGAAGFFGRNLAYAYLASHDISCIDLPLDLFGDRKDFYDRFDVAGIDIQEDLWQVKQRMMDCDVVIHLANKTRISPSWQEYEQYYSMNIGTTQKIYALSQTLGVKKFIYFSSSSVYGNNGWIPNKESDPLNPTSPYAISKMAAEAALTAQHNRLPKTELIIVRPFTMYGPFMERGKYSLVISKFIEAAQNNDPLLLDATGSQTRDFIHVNDAISALSLIIQHGKSGDIYNIGSGESVSIRELADIVSSKQVHTPPRIGHIEHTLADTSKLKELGWKPRIDVKTWLTNLVADLSITSNIKQEEK